jgi:hypothetical protein
MAKITLTQLICERKQDVSGDDEPVLYIAGQEVWEGKIGKGKSRFPDESRNFDHSVLVELKERNDKKYKLLGSWTVRDEAEGKKMLTASSSGYHYKLWYEVEADVARTVPVTGPGLRA